MVKSKSKAEPVKSKSRSKTPSTKKKQVDKKISKEKQKIAKLETELKNLKDNHIRLKAEFDNFRKRKVNEISKLLQYEGESVLKEFIPIIDDLERMINFDKSSLESIKDGILLVKTKIDKLLNNLDVEVFSKKGDKMDPDLHDAMMTQSVDNIDNDTILEVFEKGYKYKDKVIRHAKVIVNKK